ncbi:MAG: Hsp20/alpha crystallin family protein [Nitrospirae bacterium]|nr:Hsp20/alpha crystallin family protein [Nitrospirota bacterium]
MALTNWDRLARLMDPWREFEQLNQVFSGSDAPCGELPLFNVWLATDTAMVTTEVPGIETGAIDISVMGKSVTVRGSRESEEVKDGVEYHRRERWYGRFSKTFEIPFTVDADKVEARFKKGVLYISLPRAEADKPKKITIKSE